MMVMDRNGRPLGGASRIVEVEKQIDDPSFVRVDMVRIDDVVPANRSVTILHLDVEGFEQAALSGALETIMRCKPILVLEHLPEREWFGQNVLRLGYNVVGKIHDNTVLADPHGPQISQPAKETFFALQ